VASADDELQVRGDCHEKVGVGKRTGIRQECTKGNNKRQKNKDSAITYTRVMIHITHKPVMSHI